MANKSITDVASGTRKKEVSTAFKWFHATAGNGGAMLIAAVLASYLSVYMTDTLMIPAATASIIMFISTLWDAVNDPIMGVIADRTHTKWGRYRPYIFVAPILLTFFAAFIWVDWGFSSATAKAIYVLIMYIGYGMTVTMYTMPTMAIIPACVKENNERNTIIALGAGTCAFVFTIGNTFTLDIVGFFNRLGFSNGYIPLMLLCGLAAFISFWGLFFVSKGKEVYLNPPEKGNPLKSIARILKYKEIWPNIVAWLMASLGYGLMFSTSVYYMMYYYMRPDLIAVYMGVISVGAMVSMMVLLGLFLKIFKTGEKALMVSQILSIICYVILFFLGRTNFIFCCVLTFIATCFAAMQNALVNVLVNDTIDFIQLKEGTSSNGVISSLKGFAQKCGNTVVSSGILAILSASGYIAGAIGQQPESTMFALNFLKFGAPSVTGVILIIMVLINPIGKYRDAIAEMKAKEGN